MEGRKEGGREKTGHYRCQRSAPLPPQHPGRSSGRPTLLFLSLFSTAGRSLAASLHPIPVGPGEEINLEMELIK